MEDSEEDSALDHDRNLLRRGLALHVKYIEAAEAQEAARDAYEEAERADGREPAFSLTDEERAWNEHHDRLAAGIAFHKKNVLDGLNLDPGNSALYADYTDILDRACDPQSTILYDPSIRTFAMMENWGPAIIVISHCPFTGKKLPDSLEDVWNQEIGELLGTDDWSYDFAREQLPEKYFDEQWWIERKL